MSRLEKLLIMLVLTGLGLRIFHIEGGTVIQVLSAMLLMLFYIFSGFFLLSGISFGNMFKRTAYTGANGWRITAGIVSGLVFCNAVAAILFRTMAWQGAAAMACAGGLPLLTLTVAAIIVYAIRKSSFRKQLLVRCIAYTIAMIIVLLLPAGMFLLR